MKELDGFRQALPTYYFQILSEYEIGLIFRFLLHGKNDTTNNTRELLEVSVRKEAYPTLP